MLSYLLRRLSFLALTVIFTSLIIFIVAQVIPGDVARVILGREASEAALANLRRELGLDRPLAVQYLSWLWGFVGGDWGVSYSTGQPIRPLIAERLVNTLMLAGVTLVLAVPLAIALGVAAALREGGWLDALINLLSLSVVGLPEFVTGLVLIQIFSFNLGWLPANASIRAGTGFWQALPSLLLPALTASLVLLAYIARLTRASTIEVLKQPYVRSVRLKGVPFALVLWRHVLPNALLPTVTVIAISFGWLISGLIVVENVFNYPGLGRLLMLAIDRRDLPLLQAVTFVTVVAFALSNLLADLLYALLNPRIQLSSHN